jgi:2-dehydro-3-deoxy-L-rhamnonate dehydrogenase (NAD+)
MNGPGFGGAVTGGAGGIGLAYARLLAARGAQVVAADLDGAEAAVCEFGGQGRPVEAANPAAATARTEAIERDLGPVRLLVTCAGLMAG